MKNKLTLASNKWRGLKTGLLLALFCFFTFFINHNVIPADLMEARNLATAQEMVRTGNYLVPTMNGELRLEKPPLPTWIAAGVEHILPDNLSAQRSVAGTIASLMVLFFFLLVRRITKEHLLALISAIVLTTSFSVVMMGRTATWDIYCHSFMLIAIYFMYCALEQKEVKWGNFIVAGVFMGLSFLSKGPVAFYALLLPFAIGYGVALRPRLKGKIIPLCVMLTLSIIVSFWWPCYIAIFHSEVGMSVASKESANWLSRNVRPFWYYWKFAAESGIWAVFWITSLVYFFWEKKTALRKEFRLSIVWTIATIVLLSLIPEKKTRYLLPLLIPGAMNIAFYIWYSLQDLTTKRKKIVFQINGSISAAIALGIPIFLYLMKVKEGQLSVAIFVLEVFLFVGLAIWMFMALYGKKGVLPLRVFAGTALLMLVFLVVCFRPAGELLLNQQRHSIHAVRYNAEVNGLPFYHSEKEELRMELVYEANRTITPLDLDNDSLLYASLPFVLVSGEAATNLLEGKQVAIEYVDTFDHNWRKSESKRYNPNLEREVAIVRHRK